jgi:hypothetical protein
VSGGFWKVGYLTVSGSGKSVKVIVDGRVVGFVGLRDVNRMLKEKGFAATICMYVGSESGAAEGSVLAARIADVSKLKLNLQGEE